MSLSLLELTRFRVLEMILVIWLTLQLQRLHLSRTESNQYRRIQHKRLELFAEKLFPSNFSGGFAGPGTWSWPLLRPPAGGHYEPPALCRPMWSKLDSITFWSGGLQGVQRSDRLTVRHCRNCLINTITVLVDDPLLLRTVFLTDWVILWRSAGSLIDTICSFIALNAVGPGEESPVHWGHSSAFLCLLVKMKTPHDSSETLKQLKVLNKIRFKKSLFLPELKEEQ